MEIPQLDTTNAFLGILAGLAIVQVVIIAAVAIWLRRTMARVSQVAVGLEPDARLLGNEIRELIAELHSAVHRTSTLVHGIELRTRRAMAAVDAVNNAADTVVNTGMKELHAIEAGLRRGVSALVGSARRR